MANNRQCANCGADISEYAPGLRLCAACADETDEQVRDAIERTRSGLRVLAEEFDPEFDPSSGVAQAISEACDSFDRFVALINADERTTAK